VVIAGLAIVIFRRGHRSRFTRSLAAISLTAVAIGFWSVLRIRDAIADHAVFWLAALGIVALAVLTSALVEQLRDSKGDPPSGGLNRTILSGVLVIVLATAIGVRQLFLDQRPRDVRDEKSVTVQVIADDAIKTVRQIGIVRP